MHLSGNYRVITPVNFEMTIINFNNYFPHKEVEARKTHTASPTNKWRHGKPTKLHQPISGGAENPHGFINQ